MDNKADVASATAMGAAGQAFVHEHGIGSAFGHLVDGVAHVDEARDGADSDAVVHGDDDGAVGVAIENAFEADGFSKQHGHLLWFGPPGCGRRRHGNKKRAAGVMPAALEWLVAIELVRPHPPQTTGVAKPKPKIEPGGQIAEGLHGEYGYFPASYPVKGFF